MQITGGYKLSYGAIPGFWGHIGNISVCDASAKRHVPKHRRSSDVRAGVCPRTFLAEAECNLKINPVKAIFYEMCYSAFAKVFLAR
jgi:hypothetical protein